MAIKYTVLGLQVSLPILLLPQDQLTISGYVDGHIALPADSLTTLGFGFDTVSM